MNKIPIFLITGFLGCGKTTFVNKILKTKYFSNSLILVNEFGEIAIDNHIISASFDGTVITLKNGCICCKIQEDFVKTLKTVYLRKCRGEIADFTQILIETSGVTDPIVLIKSIIIDSFLGRYYEIVNVIVLIDGELAQRSIAEKNVQTPLPLLASVLLITKVDRIDSSTKNNLIKLVKYINPIATILCSGIKIEYDDNFVKKIFSVKSNVRQCNLDKYQVAVHDNFENIVFTFEKRIYLNILLEVYEALLKLEGSKILRSKSIVYTKDYQDPLLVQTVREVIYPVTTLHKYTSNFSSFVFITEKGRTQAIYKMLDYVFKSDHVY